MTKLQINITKDILRKSMYCTNKNAENNCAIALAVRDIFPNATIGEESIYFGTHIKTLGKYGISSYLPKEATNFIEAFDGLSSTPQVRLELPKISFEIEVPDSVINAINIDEIKNTLKNCNTMSLIELN